jgi:hypothetical protein
MGRDGAKHSPPVHAETIYSQIGHILDQYADEAEKLVRLTCGSARDTHPTNAGVPAADQATSHLVTDTMRSAGRLQGKVVQPGIKARWVPGSEPLLAFYRSHVDPYLRAESGWKLSLSSTSRAASLFHELKTALRPEAHPVVERIVALCDQRRQLDLQARMHRWLHVWLAIHVPFSAALVGLMAPHAFLALKFS